MNRRVGDQSWEAVNRADIARRATLLLLASEPFIRKVIREALECHGYFVETASNLSSAVDWMKRSTPRLVIIRHYLDNISGHEAAVYLQTMHHGIPVLIVGGILDDPGLENRESLRGFEIFPKQFKTAELIDEVKEMLTKYSH